jgi:acetylornithine deacetylase/succinyl-diaminopimelate desuccinylase-like protein
MNRPEPIEPADRMLREIGKTLERVGPRASCSEEERAFGRLLERRFRRFCDTVRPEAFRCQPHAFLGFIPFVSAATLYALWWLPSDPGFAARVALAAAFVTVAELLLYIELVDVFFPEREGTNIVGTIRPTGEVRQRILLTAHQDSAYEFNLWYVFGTRGVFVNVLGLAAPLPIAAAGIAAWAGWIGPDGLLTATWFGLALTPFIVAHLFFHTFRVVPGAMDDLAGVAVITEVGRDLAADRCAHTEIVILACSAEECGLRGAKRYATDHALDFEAVPTLDINVDGVYDERFLSVVTRELTTLVRHDPELVSLAEQVAGDHGWPMKRAMIPLGATDASAFAHAGVRTVALLCQDTESLAPNYHTRLDTIDRVRPESLTVMHRVVLDMVRALDARA